MGCMLAASAILAAPPDGYVFSDVGKGVDNLTIIDANRLMMFVTNHGTFGRDVANVFRRYYGTWYPFVDTASIRNNTDSAAFHSPLYAAGLWLGGKIDGLPCLALAYYEDEFVPGPMAGGTYQSDRPAFKVYKLYRDSLEGNPNADYLNWPVEQGAPVDPEGRPLLLGDRMLWTVYNDADPSQHSREAGSTNLLGIEVQQTVWEDQLTSSATDNLIWFRFKLYNRGGNEVDSFYISLWADADVGFMMDDVAGCDTLANDIFCYNRTNFDLHYGSSPPAVGFKMIYGPVVKSIGSAAYFDGHRQKGYRNLKMSSFEVLDPNGPWDPLWCYNAMRGLTRLGQPLPNGTRFAFPGDPVEGTGDIDTLWGDVRMLASYGPITFNPADSQSVLFVMGAGSGSDHLNSIAVLRSILPAGRNFLPAMQRVEVIPEPVYQCMANSVSPFDICFTIGFDELGGSGRSIDPNSLIVNGDGGFDSVQVPSTVPGFVGPATRLYLPINNFLDHYGLLWDSASYPYTITGQYTDGEPFTFEGQVAMIGHRSGDFNLDYAIDISDLVAMVEFFFADGAAPDYVRAADMNGDAQVDIGDLVRLVEYMF